MESHSHRIERLIIQDRQYDHWNAGHNSLLNAAQAAMHDEHRHMRQQLALRNPFNNFEVRWDYKALRKAPVRRHQYDLALRHSDCEIGDHAIGLNEPPVFYALGAECRQDAGLIKSCY